MAFSLLIFVFCNKVAGFYFFKKAFNDGLIDSAYIEENSTSVRLMTVHTILLRQGKIPFLKDLLKNHREVLFSFLPDIYSANEALEDLSDIDALIRIRKIPEDLQGVFGLERIKERWESRFRQEQYRPPGPPYVMASNPAPKTDSVLSALPTAALDRIKTWLTDTESVQLLRTSHSLQRGGQSFHNSRR